jgi:hypothetical protein
MPEQKAKADTMHEHFRNMRQERMENHTKPQS